MEDAGGHEQAEGQDLSKTYPTFQEDGRGEAPVTRWAEPCEEHNVEYEHQGQDIRIVPDARGGDEGEHGDDEDGLEAGDQWVALTIWQEEQYSACLDIVVAES